MNVKAEKSLFLVVRDEFAHVAMWQGTVFLVLLLLVWFNETVDIAAMFLGQPSSPPDVVRGCVSSAGVLLAAIIAIGHTYVQQRNVVSGMLTICCYCHKIRINQVMWQRIEEYIGKHSLALFSHGVCPECFEKARQEELAPGTEKSAASVARGNACAP